MCFSATASFSAAAALGVTGAYALARAHDRRYRLLAAIPLLFAVQQAIEGLVWMSYPWQAPVLRSVATQIYSVFSHLLWPVYVPWAVRAIETVPSRRRALLVLAVAGLASAAFLAWGMVADPIQVEPVGGHLEYRSPHFYIAISLTLYLAATTLSLVLSSVSAVRTFGFLALASAALAGAVWSRWFISVWCFFAAVLSAYIAYAVHLASHRHPAPTQGVTS
ncbi:MAG: DUF6629 family protein [Pseudomonadota bacterium]